MRIILYLYLTQAKASMVLAYDMNYIDGILNAILCI